MGETSSIAQVALERPQRVQGIGVQSAIGFVVTGEQGSLEERLFDALASAKIATATFAMHLPRTWRDRFFERLDAMHDTADWEEEDATLEARSIRTFLRTWLLWRPTTNPGFGISSRGNLISAWASGDRRLTVEYLANDLLSWLVMIPHKEEDWVERGSGISKLGELIPKLETYGASDWMYDKEKGNDAVTG